MTDLPRDRRPDSTIAFLRDGYEFISNRCDRFRSDVFETRAAWGAVCLAGGGAGASCPVSQRPLVDQCQASLSSTRRPYRPALAVSQSKAALPVQRDARRG